MASAARLFYMAVWRNWISLKQYKLNFVFSFVTGALWGVGMLFFALVLDSGLLMDTVGTTNYASFLILGISFQAWQEMSLWRGSRMFTEELGTGLIDYTFTCPFSRYWYIVCNVAALGVQETVFFLPLLAVGLLFTRETLTLPGIALGLLATALSVLVMIQIGACFAALVLRYRQVSSVFGFFSFSFQFFTGMLVPVQALPAALRQFGLFALPQTHGMDLLRHYVMGTYTIVGAETEWLILLAQLFVYGCLALFAVTRLERSAREQGLHYL